MSQEAIDLIRVCHLVFFAMGMGSGLYFDMRALRRINTPFTSADVAEFNSVHRVVFFALAGLWATGLLLIQVRTGFVMTEFSPKIWLKLVIVAALTLNAFVIGFYVLPRVRRAVGRSAIDLPLRDMLPMTMSASASLFCWLGGLVLGASVTLKAADWVTLSRFFAAEFAVIVLGSVCGVLILRAVLLRRSAGARREAQPHAAKQPVTR